MWRTSSIPYVNINWGYKSRMFLISLSMSRPIAYPPLCSLTVGSSRAISVLNLSNALLEKERCKTLEPPFVSSSFRAHSQAYLLWTRSSLLCLSRNRLEKVPLSSTLSPQAPKSPNNVASVPSLLLERRIDRLSAPEAAEADTRGKQRMEKEDLERRVRVILL